MSSNTEAEIGDSYPPPTSPVPHLPYRLGEFRWQPLTASYEARIYFTKIGVRGKQTEHALGFLALKDYFSHPENPDFEPYCNLTELDYKTIGKIFIEAVNAENDMERIEANQQKCQEQGK